MQNALSLRDICDRCWGYNVILSLKIFYIFGRAGSSLLCRLLQLRWAGAPLHWSVGAPHGGLSYAAQARGWGTEAMARRLAGSRAQARVWWCSGLAVLRHAGSSQPRDRTGIPRLARQVLNHWAAKGAPRLSTWCTPAIAVSTRVSSANPGFCFLTGVHVL